MNIGLTKQKIVELSMANTISIFPTRENKVEPASAIACGKWHSMKPREVRQMILRLRRNNNNKVKGENGYN
jgi:hypothetical protein